MSGSQLVRLALALCALVIVVALPAYGQQQPSADEARWVGIASGIGISASKPGISDRSTISMNLSYGFERGRFSYQVAFDLMEHFALFGRPRYRSQALQAGVGLRRARTHGVLTGFVGPSLGYHQVRSYSPDSDSRVFRSLSAGVTANAQFIARPVPEFGAGIGLFATLNSVQSYHGIRFTLFFSNGR